MSRTERKVQLFAGRVVRRAILLVAIGVAAAVTIGRAEVGGHDDDHQGQRPFAIGLWGDVPYSPLQATVGVPNLIEDMNAQHLAFTVNDGDLKAGSGECSNAVYAQALNAAGAFKVEK